MRKVLVLTLMAVLLVSACSANTGSNNTETTDAKSVTSNDIENTTRAIEKARLIAELVTQESDGFIFVSFVAIPSHGVSQSTQREFFGVHYSMQILKRADELTQSDRTRAQELAGRIFQLTTLHILKLKAAAGDITHMGVQIVNPDAWFWEGSDAHLHIASSEALLQIPEGASSAQWFNVASDTPLLLITESQLAALLNQLQEK